MDLISSLQELIEALEYGNRFHISIEFFRNDLRAVLQLPRRRVIHSTPFCDEVKSRRGVDPCLQCKGRAMEKARRTGKPFGGLCINGVYEFCYPVFINNDLVCIIFVGNIVNEPEIFLEKSGLPADSPLLNTMQRNMDHDACLKIASVIASYILMIQQHLSDVHLQNKINTTVMAVKGYVDCYFYLNLSLSSIAKMYNYNEKYLGILFKKQVGVSFHEYLNNRRLFRATQLLEQSNSSILEIATRVGFNNVTYFNRIFRQRYGMPPSRMRVELKKKDKV